MSSATPGARHEIRFHVLLGVLIHDLGELEVPTTIGARSLYFDDFTVFVFVHPGGRCRHIAYAYVPQIRPLGIQLDDPGDSGKKNFLGVHLSSFTNVANEWP